VSTTKNLLAGFTNAAWSAILGLAVLPIYLKYLGIESYGLIGFSIMMQSVMSLLDMGIAPTINREIARFSARGKLQEAGKLLHTLATRDQHPESVPVNALVSVKGTPLEGRDSVKIWDMVRMIATARILMPKAMVRLSAGRNEMNYEQQALCFLAGANSIFTGEKLLTTPNPGFDADKEMFELLGLKPRESFKAEKGKEVATV